MKKLMSLVIAVLFALGMTTVSFAADNTAPATDKAPVEKKADEKKVKKAKKTKKAKKAKKTEEKKTDATAPAAPAK